MFVCQELERSLCIAKSDFQIRSCLPGCLEFELLDPSGGCVSSNVTDSTFAALGDPLGVGVGPGPGDQDHCGLAVVGTGEGEAVAGARVE